MQKLKIKKLKNLKHAKSVFNFISASHKTDAMLFDNLFLPLHDLYNKIIDNTFARSQFQFYAKVDKNIVGAMVSSPLTYDNNNLYLEVFSIQKQFRHNGFAKIMLNKTLYIAENNNFKKIRVDYTHQSASFFQKNDFKLFLEIHIPNYLKQNLKQICLSMNLNLVDIINSDSLIVIKFEADNYDMKILNIIKRTEPTAKAFFVFERNII